jgi:outer membrane lipoprotein-sorting protein
MTRTPRSFGRGIAWTAPLATAALIGVAVAVPMTASAGTPRLDGTTPEALLAAVRTTDVTHLSGQVEETARLGLPSLAGQDDAAALNWQTLVTGTHTANLAVDGPQRQRLALLGTLAESDVVHNGSDVWTYASRNRAVTHVVLPAARPDGAGTSAPDPGDLMTMTPLGAAQHLLTAVTPTTGVSMAENTRVAGQDAYALVLTPKQADSTVGRVVIAVDATRHIPLRVQVFDAGGRTADPVFETGFTSISYDRPSAATFDFTAPAGATVTTRDMSADHVRRSADGSAPTVLGSGWTSVAEFSPGSGAVAALRPATGARGDHASRDMLDRLFTVQPNGDRLLTTALVNVLLTADGRMFAGAVQPSVLQASATR